MANPGKAVKIGVIGCGNVTENQHLPALRSLPEAEVVAVADIDEQRLRQVSDRFGIPRRHVDYRDLLSDPTVEAVGVCVPTEFHVEVALAALAAGKHVFVEKPVALSLEETDRLIERAAQSSNKVMVGFNLRWHRLVQQARDMVQRGALGPIELFCSTFTTATRYRGEIPEWKKHRALGGGVLIENGIHYFDVCRFLLQSEIEEVFATSRSEQWDDLTGTVTARMANGALVVFISSETTGAQKQIQVYGQAGYLDVSLYRFDGLKFVPLSRYPGDVVTRWQEIVHFLKEAPQALSNVRRGGDYHASFSAEWHHFIDSIRHDTPVQCSLRDGRMALQVALAVTQSVASRQPVQVTQAPRDFASIAEDSPPVLSSQR